MIDDPAPTPPQAVPSATGPTPGASPADTFRRHPVRWMLAAAGLAAALAFGGYGVTQAATSSSSSSTAAAAGLPGAGGSAPSTGASGTSGTAGTPPANGAGKAGSMGGTGSAGSRGGAGSMGNGAEAGTGGKVTAINGDTITMTNLRGKVIKVVVTSSTVFKDGTKVSTDAALRVGDFAVVTGSTASNGTVTATTVVFGATPPAGGPGGA
jgi:hypothetical protein